MGHPPEELRLTHALIGTRYFKERPESVSSAVLRGIAEAVKASKNDEAVALLTNIITPRDGLKLLIDRRFEPMWPQIERWAGDLTAQRDTMVAATQTAFERDPRAKTRVRYADALAAAGRMEEAIGVLRAGLDARAPTEDAYYRGNEVSALANLLNEDGQTEAALKVFDGEIDRAGPPIAGRGNLLANRGMMRAWAGQTRQALLDAEVGERAARTEPSAPSEAALLWYGAIRVCALARGGQIEAARGNIVRVAAARSLNPEAYRRATLCLEDVDAFKNATLLRLAQDDDRAGTMLMLQRPALLRNSPEGRVSEAMVAKVRTDPQVAAALAKYGRDVPANDTPALVDWRQ